MIRLVLFSVLFISKLASANTITKLNENASFDVLIDTCAKKGPLKVVAIKHSPANFDHFFTATNQDSIAKWSYHQSDSLWQRDLNATDISVAYDGKMVAVASSRGTGYLLNADSGEIVSNLKTHERSEDRSKVILTSVAWAGKRDLVAASDHHGNIYVWSIDRELPVQTIKKSASLIKKLFFSKDGNFLVAVYKDDVLIVNLESQKIVANVNSQLTNSIYITDVYMPETYENFLVITSYYDTIIYNLEKFKVAFQYPTPRSIFSRTIPTGVTTGLVRTITNSKISLLYRLHRSPYLDIVEVETGKVLNLFQDPRFKQDNNNPASDPHIVGFTALAVHPENSKSVLIATMDTRVRMNTRCYDTKLAVKQYLLP